MNLCPKCGLVKKLEGTVLGPQITRSSLYPYMKQEYRISSAIASPMSEQVLKLDDGHIRDITVQILAPQSQANPSIYPKLLVQGVLLTHLINGQGVISDYGCNDRQFQNIYQMPLDIDTDRVTWSLESKTNMDHPIQDIYTEHNKLVIRAPYLSRTVPNEAAGQYFGHQPDNLSCDCNGTDFETNERNRNQNITRLMCVNDREEGRVEINRRSGLLHHTLEAMTTNGEVQAINVQDGDNDSEKGSEYNFPIRMTDQPATYQLTKEGCELSEDLDAGLDPTSLRIHMRKDQGRIWLTFTKEVVQKSEYSSNSPFKDTYKLRTTSRREYKLNPKKFDLSKTKARTTNGKITIKVPFRKD